MVEQSGLCDGVLPARLDTPYTLDTRTMSDVEGFFNAKDMEAARKCFLEAHPHDSLSDADLYAICNVFVSVSTRSAALTAAVLVSLGSLIKPENAKNCTVSCTGTVIEKYPNFQSRCQQYLDMLAAPRGIKLTLSICQDGSVLGPVIAAAMT
jgi:hexokinase